MHESTMKGCLYLDTGKVDVFSRNKCRNRKYCHQEINSYHAFDLPITLSAPGVDAQPQIVEKRAAQPHSGGMRSRRKRQEYTTHAAAQPGFAMASWSLEQ